MRQSTHSNHVISNGRQLYQQVQVSKLQLGVATIVLALADPAAENQHIDPDFLCWLGSLSLARDWNLILGLQSRLNCRMSDCYF